MDRQAIKVTESHDRQVLTMNSASDYAGWARTFPDPPLSTHVVSYHWSGSGSVKTLVIEPVLADAPVQAATTAAENEPTVVAAPDPADGHAPVRAKLVEELNKLTVADLQTRAVEVGLTLPPNAKKPQMVAAIADKLAPPGVTR